MRGRGQGGEGRGEQSQEPVEAGAGRGRPDGVSSREVPDAARDAIKELIKG